MKEVEFESKESGEASNRKTIPVIDGFVSEEAIEDAMKEYDEENKDLGPRLRLTIDDMINKLESLKKGLDQLGDPDNGYISEVNLNETEYAVSEDLMEIHRGLICVQSYYSRKRNEN